MSPWPGSWPQLLAFFQLLFPPLPCQLKCVIAAVAGLAMQATANNTAKVAVSRRFRLSPGPFERINILLAMSAPDGMGGFRRRGDILISHLVRLPGLVAR